MKIVDYLDITLDFNTGTHRPYIKPNGNPIYVHVESNHPPNIITNVPKSINTRLSKLSSNAEVFKETIPPYQEALEKSGHKYQLKYDPQATTSAKKHKKKGRQRQITYFNPPY